MIRNIFGPFILRIVFHWSCFRHQIHYDVIATNYATIALIFRWFNKFHFVLAGLIHGKKYFTCFPPVIYNTLQLIIIPTANFTYLNLTCHEGILKLSLLNLYHEKIIILFCPLSHLEVSDTFVPRSVESTGIFVIQEECFDSFIHEPRTMSHRWSCLCLSSCLSLYLQILFRFLVVSTEVSIGYFKNS